MTGPRPCTLADCTAHAIGHGLCTNHYRAALAAGRITLVRAARPAPGICPPEHKHASSTTCYTGHGCRCTACRYHHAAVKRQRDADKAAGTFHRDLVDAEPVREHVELLSHFGMGYGLIATTAGLGRTTVRALIWGSLEPGPRKGTPRQHISSTAAKKLLAVRPSLDTLSPFSRIPSRGAHRRLQALVAIGWSQHRLASRLGMTRANFATLIRRDNITVRTHRDVVALFDELWDQAPPRTRRHEKSGYTLTIAYARARRWLPPLAWDDIDNDVEPPVVARDRELIDEIAVELAMDGERVRLTTLERREAVTRLVVKKKLSDGTIAELLHIADRTVLRIRDELGLPAAVGADGRAVA